MGVFDTFTGRDPFDPPCGMLLDPVLAMGEAWDHIQNDQFGQEVWK